MGHGFILSRSMSQQIADPGTIGSAQNMSGTILHLDERFSLAAGMLHFLDMLEVDDGGSMYAEEGRGIKLRFNRSHGLPQQVTFPASGDAKVISLGGDGPDVPHLKKDNASFVAND